MLTVEPQDSRTRNHFASVSPDVLGFSCKKAGKTATYRGYPRRARAVRPALSRSRAELRLDALAEGDRDDLDSIGRLIAAREAAGVEHLAAHPQTAASSWALPAEAVPGPSWSSRQQWLTAVSTAVLTDEARALMARVITASALRHIAAALASFADANTGRGVTASTSTVGARAAVIAGRDKPYSPRHVRAARAILNKLGLAQEAARGRYLTIAERMAAVLHHGNEQRRAASLWTLVMPAAHVKAVCHLPRSGSALLKSPSRRWLPTRAQARAGAPSAQRSSPPSPARSLRSRQAHKIVAHLVRCCPGLDKTHLGALVDVIARHVDTTRWTSTDLIAVLDDTGGVPTTVRFPARYLERRLAGLAAQLAEPSPSEVARSRSAAQAARQAQLRSERARARAQAATPAQRAAHKARIDALLAAKTGRRATASPAAAPRQATTPGRWKRRLS